MIISMLPKAESAEAAVVGDFEDWLDCILSSGVIIPCISILDKRGRLGDLLRKEGGTMELVVFRILRFHDMSSNFGIGYLRGWRRL